MSVGRYDHSLPAAGEASLVHPETSPVSEMNKEDQETEGIVSADPSQPGPVNLMGITDVHRTISRQLEQATAVADSGHQPCPFCSYVFSSVLFLIKHLKYRHGINLEMEIGTPQETKHPSHLTPQQPSLNNHQHPCLDPAPVSGSNPPGANSMYGTPFNIKEQFQSSVGSKDDVETESTIGPSIRVPEVNPAGVEEQRSQLQNEVMLQRMDQLRRPKLNQVAEIKQPGLPIIICDKCTRAFTNLEDLEQHQRVHNITKTYKCEHCNKLFQNPSSLKKHTKLHTDGKIYACDHCHKSFAAAAYLKTHMRLHTKQKPFVCKHCGKAFAASGTLISHERIHINDKPYGCEFCGKRFRQGSHLNRHKIIHTNMKPHVCSKCNRAFADVANLRRHERIHNQDNPNVCGECGKSFINLSSLKKHERLHTNEKPYICRHCSKPFASSGNLISHERTHTNERPYVCKECGKAFTQSSHLKAHMGTHSTDTLYVCKHCGRGFTQRSTLCVHERIHLNKKPYICKVCDRAFTQSSTLKAHIRTHTKEKSHACKVCGKAFSARGNLRSHELIHTDEKPFKCGVCPKAFKQGSTLRAHERTHTKERPYVCRVCGKAFADGSNLKAHTLRIHCKGTGFDLGPLPGGDLLTSAMLAQTANETPNMDDLYSVNKFSDLTIDSKNSSQSPVGIKIRKTLDGLTSQLRFAEEENISPNNSTDHDYKARETEKPLQGTLELESRSDLTTKNDNTLIRSQTYLATKVSCGNAGGSQSHNSTENVLNILRRQASKSELSEEQHQVKQLNNDEATHPSGSCLDSKMMESITNDEHVFRENFSQSPPTLLKSNNAGDHDTQGSSEEELASDEDDYDLESPQMAGDQNNSGEDSEAEDMCSADSPESCRQGNSDFSRHIHQVTETRAAENLESRSSASHMSIGERAQCLQTGRAKREIGCEAQQDTENGDRKTPESSRHDLLVESSGAEESIAMKNRGLFDLEITRSGHVQDAPCSGRQRQFSCRKSLVDDLELSRIFPLN